MKKFHLLIINMLLLASCAGNQQHEETQPELRFHNGKFRIAQFTDFHWEAPDSVNALKRENILQCVAAQKPDLCVLTGDIVTGNNPKQSWREVISAFEETGIPYAITLGNHDPEAWSQDSIFDLLAAEAPHCLNKKTIEGVYGYGNGVLEIMGESTDSTRAAVYLIDSGSHYPQGFRSNYDNIHFSQLLWYVGESNKLKAKNNGEPVPAVAFFHVCTPEYELITKDSTMYQGHFLEPCCPSEVNSGFISTAFEQGDIMGTFVGHDHTNDYIGMWKGIALGYGRQSGVMGKHAATPQGCRIVELHEGFHTFETWTAAPESTGDNFFYPFGDTTELEKTIEYLPATPLDENSFQPGLRYEYFEGSEAEVSLNAMFSQGEKKDEGFVSNLDISQAPAADHFGYIFSGWFLMEERGINIFGLSSDDGSRLFIDDKLIIDNDGSHSSTPVESMIGLEKGWHKFRLEYFEDYMGQELSLFITNNKHSYEPLPDKLFCTEK